MARLVSSLSPAFAFEEQACLHAPMTHSTSTLPSAPFAREAAGLSTAWRLMSTLLCEIADIISGFCDYRAKARKNV